MTTTEILKKLRKDIKQKTYDMVPTAKNRTSRWKYGLSILDIEDFLISITEEDIYKGPVDDYDYPGEKVFIFKKEIIHNTVFYVKIKEKDGKIKILSCHEDEEIGGEKNER